MNIDINNKTRSNINKKLIKQVVLNFIKYFKIKKSEISIVFVGDKRIKSLNNFYKKKDKVTDVLSFLGEDNFLGEIIIDYQQIKRQDKIYNNTIKQELIFILVHGLLHLIGYKDKTKKAEEEMNKLGENFINSLKL